MANLRTLKQTIVAVALAATVACGGSSNNPNNPSPGGGSAGPSGATITIGSNGAVSPSAVTINAGESVTFVNNSSTGRNISSDPHPAHGDCPAINALGVVGPNSTRLTNALTTSRTCGFHDHNDPDNPALKGTITVR